MGVSGVASFLFIPLLLFFSGEDELLERDDLGLDFSGDEDDLDLEAESLCE